MDTSAISDALASVLLVGATVFGIMVLRKQWEWIREALGGGYLERDPGGFSGDPYEDGFVDVATGVSFNQDGSVDAAGSREYGASEADIAAAGARHMAMQDDSHYLDEAPEGDYSRGDLSVASGSAGDGSGASVSSASHADKSAWSGNVWAAYEAGLTGDAGFDKSSMSGSQWAAYESGQRESQG